MRIPNSPLKRRAALAALLAIASTSLVGCSDPGATTCDEYAALSYSERQKTEKALLEAHNLETRNLDNMLGLSEALSKYCGVYSFKGNDKARSNGSATLEKAVNWSSKKW
ncbi:hypothetical protein [Paenarthrobacter sp. FR1]|uniref:hypothetical protein n=1 Tax=Paenarthrobacter sp. FR1 TaxID=3439548 RepID=UPI003DA341CB